METGTKTSHRTMDKLLNAVDKDKGDGSKDKGYSQKYTKA